jgi:HSP20 family molecular chaperone IbpA
MLVPRKNDFSLLDDFFEDDFFPKREKNLMKTDIIEKKDKYVVDIDLPGFTKDNINLSLENGYLNIHAKVSKEENHDKDEKYVHRERFYGECSRSFYVGDQIEEKDIDAEFKNGILKIMIPKKEEDKKLAEKKQIMIK